MTSRQHSSKTPFVPALPAAEHGWGDRDAALRDSRGNPRRATDRAVSLLEPRWLELIDRATD